MGTESKFYDADATGQWNNIVINKDGITVYGQSAGKYNAGAWNNLEIFLNLETGKMNVYLNGSSRIQNAGIKGKAPFDKMMQRFTIRGAANTTQAVAGYIDNYKIKYVDSMVLPETDSTESIVFTDNRFKLIGGSKIVQYLNTANLTYMDLAMAMPESPAVNMMFFSPDGSMITNYDQLIADNDYCSITSESGSNTEKYTFIGASDPTKAIIYQSDFSDVTGRNKRPAGFDGGVGNANDGRYTEPAKGVGGKASGDTSFMFYANNDTPTAGTVNNNLLIDKNFTSTGNLVIEYSIFKTPNIEVGIAFKDAAAGWANLGNLPLFNQDGALIKDMEFTYDFYRWNRVALFIQPGKTTYDLYLNGKFLGAIDAGKVIPELGMLRFQSNYRGSAGNEGRAYLDDMVMYSTESESYDAANAATQLSSTAYNIDNNSHSIGITEFGQLTVEEFLSNVQATAGTVVGLFDEKMENKLTTGILKATDVLAVLAPDGVTYQYYTFGVKVKVTSPIYTVSGNVISNIAIGTPAEAFLNNISINDGATNFDVAVIRNESAVTGAVETDDKLQISLGGTVVSVLTLSVRPVVIDQNFNDYTGKIYLDDKTAMPTGFNGAAFGDRDVKETAESAYFEDADTGSSRGKALMLKNDPLAAEPGKTASVQQNIYQDFISEPLKGNVVFEFSMMTPDYNVNKLATFKGDKDGKNDFWPQLVTLHWNKDIQILNQVIGTYEANKWYHFAFEIDLEKHAVTCYINGAPVLVNQYFEGMLNTITHVRFQSAMKVGSPTTLYIDDVKLYAAYPGSYSLGGFDTTLESSVLYVQNNIAPTIRGIIPANMTIESFLSSATYPENAVLQFFAANGSEITDLTTSLASGMAVRITSENGVVANDYTITDQDMFVPSDSIYPLTMNANTTFEVKAGNFTAGAKTARLAAAVYDQTTKQLVAVYLGAPVDMTVPEGSSYAIQNMSVTVEEKGREKDIVKVFVWDGVDNARPLAAPILETTTFVPAK